MMDLDPEYITALAQQFGFLGAFLGGVSATFFVTLLTLAKPGRVTRWAIGLAASAAVSFIVTAALSMTLITRNHPSAPDFIASQSSDFERIVSGLCFIIGTYCLLAAIAVSGWSRSRTLGKWMTFVAVLGAIPVTMSAF